jgi:RNA polymerase II-associated factor 1
VEDKLKRKTPFIARVSYQNTLPDLPCDPKMLIPPLDRHELSKFKLTQMELAFRPDLISGMEPGNLPLIDAQRFCVTKATRELDPEDRAIIEGHKSKGATVNVSWLMKTRHAIPHACK